jgi:hypothetical protein
MYLDCPPSVSLESTGFDWEVVAVPSHCVLWPHLHIASEVCGARLIGRAGGVVIIIIA